MRSDNFNEDCLPAMRLIPSKSIPLAIVDPPWGINAPEMQMGSNPTRSRTDGHGSGPGVSAAVKIKKGRLNLGGGYFADKNLTNLNWDTAIPSPEYFYELERVSKNRIIWGMNYFPLPPTRGVICWDKYQFWENFSQVELAWTDFDCPAKIVRLSNRGGRNDVKKIHPTQKPVRLYEWCLKNFAKPGDLILDTHMGSGSLRIACDIMGFDFIGYEIDPYYFNEGNKWFTEHKKQTTLF